VLQVRDVHYLITYECVTTPLLPLSLAAIAAAPWRRGVRALAALAAVPLFVALSVVRLMTLAVPAMLFGSRPFLTHGFNQLLVAIVAIAVAACAGARAIGWAAAARRTAAAMAIAIGLAATAGILYTRLLSSVFPAAMHDAADLQGALLTLPAFQLVFFAALAFVLRERASMAAWLTAGAVLAVTQIGLLAVAPSARALASPDLLAIAWRGCALTLPAGLAVVTTVASR